ncbi:HNH endonuclease domain-containing protein [Anaerolinea thermolimosa]|uniref:HNH endonuclease domain-containing protein n=1 Tax=Anaerolinea thermolimosa TaxID=229919 RepID=UPI00191C71E8|nr:HNH endonuclease domain-containing protein [Anaerolinea thermolimosa]
MERTGISIESSSEMIVKTALDHFQKRDEIGQQVASLANYVPYRFLRQFFAENLRSEQDWKINRHIREMAEQAFHSRQPCLYRFVNSPDPAIEIHPEWFKYFQQHLTILTGFCLWHLINYLQKHNPNVPNIAGKLFEPQTRDLKTARLFWNLVLRKSSPLICIYSSKPILPGNFSIDHFLPWRFVGHDLLWNLIPTPKEVNASKSDNLPDPSYLEPFAKMQYQAVQSIATLTRAERMLEDYVILFKISSIDEFRRMSLCQFTNTIQATIAPQLQIAANMGFSQRWKYNP